MNAIKSIVFVVALVALLGAAGSDAIFGHKKHNKQQPQVVTNYVPVQQNLQYGSAEPAYYPEQQHQHQHHHRGQHHRANGAGLSGASATATASGGGFATASASAVNVQPAPYYNHQPQHEVEQFYQEPLYDRYQEPQRGYEACVAPPCYGGLVNNFYPTPAPPAKKQGFMSKLFHH